MNILILSHTSNLGGANRSLDTVINVLKNNHYQITILTTTGYYAEKWKSQSLQVFNWIPPSLYWFFSSVYSTGQNFISIGYIFNIFLLPIRLIKAHFIITKLIKQNKIEIIYINSLVLFPVFILFKIGNKKLSIIWHIREVVNSNLPNFIQRLIIKGIGKVSSKIICITHNEAIPFIKYNPVIIHNNIGSEIPDELEPKKFNKKIMMSSGFLPGKGIEDFIYLSKMFLSIDPSIQFYCFVTKPSIGSRLKYKIFNTISKYFYPIEVAKILINHTKTLTIDNLNIVLGHQLSQSDYNNFSVYIRTDETGSPWGRDIIEAMSSGLVVIAVGTSNVFVKNGETGFLVGKHCLEEIKDKIISFSENEMIFRHLSLNTLNSAKENFSFKNYSKLLLENIK